MLPVILIAAAFGWWVGGGAGALIAAILAAVIAGVARSAPAGLLRDLAATQSTFLDTTFAVMGALCKVDGRVSREEIAAAEEMFRRLNLSEDARRSAQAAFSRGKAADFDLDAALREFVARCGHHRGLLSMFMQVQLVAVAADGALDPAEHEMLLRIARAVGLPEAEVARLESMLGHGMGDAGTSEEKLDAAYRTLGVTPDASDADVKKAYRRLVNQNHPDKLAARGLPESMKTMAEEKTREIVEAHETIVAARRAAR